MISGVGEIRPSRWRDGSRFLVGVTFLEEIPMRWLFRRKIMLWIFIPFTLLLLCVMGSIYLFRTKQQQELDKQIARIEAKDKDWQAGPLIRSLPTFPDDKNSYSVMDVLFREHGVVMQGRPQEPELTNLRLLPEQMPVEAVDWMGEWHFAAQDALVIARKLKDYPQGRHPVQYKTPFYSILLPTVQSCRTIAWMLLWDSRYLCQMGKYEEAFANLRAMKNCSASLHHEPFLICNLVSIAIDAINANMLTEILSQGQVSEDSLALLQKELEAHIQFNLLAAGIRGERAAFYDTSLSILEDFSLLQAGGLAGGMAPNKFAATVSGIAYRTVAIGDRAKGLELLTDMLETANGPAEEIRGKAKIMEDNIKRNLTTPRYLLTRLFLPAMQKVSEAYVRHLANLRTCIVALACERFRLANGRWPAKLEELQPKFIKDLPKDPFNDQPLKLKKEKDGICIYSVGENEIDDAGDVTNRSLNDPRYYGGTAGSNNNLGTTQNFQAKDRGIRLWDPAARRKAPAMLLLSDGYDLGIAPMEYSMIPSAPYIQLYSAMGVGVSALLQAQPEVPLGMPLPQFLPPGAAGPGGG
jgi:hypothetical protein